MAQNITSQTFDTSPIGTTSPNSGSTGNTNSTYAPGAYTSGVTPQGTATAYKVNDTDYQGFVLFNTNSAVTVTLNGAVRTNFSCTIMNLGTGAITLAPDSGYLVNGAASLVMASQQGAQVFFANRAWNAFVGTQTVPVVPANYAAPAHQFLNVYTAPNFTSAQPAFTDISGNLATAQLPTAGVSGTATLAKLTVGGTNGSLTITNGIITAIVNPT